MKGHARETSKVGYSGVVCSRDWPGLHGDVRLLRRFFGGAESRCTRPGGGHWVHVLGYVGHVRAVYERTASGKGVERPSYGGNAGDQVRNRTFGRRQLAGNKGRRGVRSR